MLRRNERGQVCGAGPGRPKGSKNRFTLLRRELLATYDELNPHTGREHLVEWARKNPTAFYRIIARLLPRTPSKLNGHGTWSDQPNSTLLDMIQDADATPTGSPSSIKKRGEDG